MIYSLYVDFFLIGRFAIFESYSPLCGGQITCKDYNLYEQQNGSYQGVNSMIYLVEPPILVRHLVSLCFENPGVAS